MIATDASKHLLVARGGVVVLRSFGLPEHLILRVINLMTMRRTAVHPFANQVAFTDAGNCILPGAVGVPHPKQVSRNDKLQRLLPENSGLCRNDAHRHTDVEAESNLHSLHLRGIALVESWYCKACTAINLRPFHHCFRVVYVRHWHGQCCPLFASLFRHSNYSASSTTGDSTIVLAETSTLLRSLAKVNRTEEIRQLLDDMDNKQFA